jgi:AraC-like DNA-binding protein
MPLCYREIAPSPRLARYVQCFWILEGEGGAPQHIPPDGRIELIFHYGDPFRRIHHDGRAERQPRSLLAGQITGPVVVAPADRTGVVGVRFRPAGAAAFFVQPLSEFTGGVHGLDAVWRTAELEERIAAARDDTGRVAVLESVLTPRQDPDAGVEVALAAVQNSGGLTSVDQLARIAGLSRRHLERKFLDRVGIAPKMYARIARFQRALRTRQEGGAWLDSALASGYYDQAHFIRDFRQFTGCTPTSYSAAAEEYAFAAQVVMSQLLVMERARAGSAG